MGTDRGGRVPPRALWLEGDLEGSLGWLERATAIRPNYAQGMPLSELGF